MLKVNVLTGGLILKITNALPILVRAMREKPHIAHMTAGVVYIVIGALLFLAF